MVLHTYHGQPKLRQGLAFYTLPLSITLFELSVKRAPAFIVPDPGYGALARQATGALSSALKYTAFQPATPGSAASAG